MKLPALAGARRILVVVLGLLVVGAAVVVAVNVWWPGEQATKSAAKTGEAAAELVRGKDGQPIEPPTVRLSELAAKSLGINQKTIVPVKVPAALRALPPQMGTLGFDNDRLFAVRSRFPGEVSEIVICPTDQRGSFPLKGTGSVIKSSEPPAKDKDRLYTVGDRVKKGDLLAI